MRALSEGIGCIRALSAGAGRVPTFVQITIAPHSLVVRNSIGVFGPEG